MVKLRKCGTFSQSTLIYLIVMLFSLSCEETSKNSAQERMGSTPPIDDQVLDLDVRLDLEIDAGDQGGNFWEDQGVFDLEVDPLEDMDVDSGASPPLDYELCAELGDLEIEWDRVTGAPAVIWGDALSHILTQCHSEMTEGSSPLEISEALISSLSKLYRVRGELRLTSEKHTTDGRAYLRFDQILPYDIGEAHVFGSQLTFHFDQAGKPIQVTGRSWPIRILPELISLRESAELIEILESFLPTSVENQLSLVEEPRLTILPRDGQFLLGHELIVSEGENTRSWRVFIEQTSQHAILIEPLTRDGFPNFGESVSITGQINENEGGMLVELSGWRNQSDQRYYLHDQMAQWGIYAVNETCNLFTECISHSSAIWEQHDSVAITAAYHLSQTLAYLKDWLGRDSYDDAGGYVIATIRFPCYQPNAFYMGSGQLGLGTWEGLPLVTRDIIAHELFHGVTQESANLVYSGESGALNESFSDIFAVLMGARQGGMSQQSELDWLIGNVVFAERDQRNLSDPKSDRYRPRRPSRFEGEFWFDPHSEIDHGGVHINSSLQSFFFYLLLMGGDGINEELPYSLVGIGIDDAEVLAYRVLTEYAHPTSDHEAIRLAWIAAARALDEERGLQGEQSLRAQVEIAWGAVGVGDLPCISSYLDADFDGFGDPNTPSTECRPPQGYVINHLDCDDQDFRQATGALEVCGDGVINDCTLTAEACGELAIDMLAGGEMKLTWASDCLVQITEDGQDWRDLDLAPTRDECDAEIIFTPSSSFALFRLRLP